MTTMFSDDSQDVANAPQSKVESKKLQRPRTLGSDIATAEFLAKFQLTILDKQLTQIL